MKLSAIIQARALAFIELYDLDPRGKAFFPDTIKRIADRYEFLQVPKPSEADEQKGVELKTGKMGDKVIDVLKIFETLLVVETHSNTSDSKAILEDMLNWGKKDLGLTFDPSMIRNWAYVSILTFYSDVNLVAHASSPTARLAEKVTGSIAQIWGLKLPYEPRSIIISHDPMIRKSIVASFSIQPRAESPYSENKFYSEAPLPTDTHIKYLEEFEADVLAASK
jgi:hypothetical protein